MFKIVIQKFKTIFKIVIAWISIIESVSGIEWYQTVWSQGSSKHQKKLKNY